MRLKVEVNSHLSALWHLSPFLNPFIEFMSNVLPLGGVGGYPKLLELAEEPNPEYFWDEVFEKPHILWKGE